MADVDKQEKLNLVKTIVVLIDKESTGRKYAVGRLCKVYLIKNDKIVIGHHRARG